MNGGGTMTITEQLVLGIDIGGTNMRFGLVNDALELTAFERLSTREIFGDECDPAQKLADCIKTYCDRHIEGKMPKAVSIGFPSTINRERTVVVQTPNISCISDNLAIVDVLEKTLKIPAFINRDVNDLLLFDLEDLGVADQGCVAGIYFGTGIGNSVMVDGKILLGHNGVASELGHLPIYGNHRICMCGNESCLETLVSGIALERIQKQEFPDTPIQELFATKMDTSIMKDFLTGMAQTAAAEANLFDPDCLIIGGGLLQMRDFPRELFEKEVHRFARKPYPEKTLDIRYSRPNQENGVVGAAIYAQKRMQDLNYL